MFSSGRPMAALFQQGGVFRYGPQQGVVVQIRIVQPQLLIQAVFHAHHAAGRFQPQLAENVLQRGQIGRRIQIAYHFGFDAAFLQQVEGGT